MNERLVACRHAAFAVWLIGLSGSGKSTLARALRRTLHEAGCQAVIIDGDHFRHGVSADLGFSAVDRTENIRRAAEVTALFLEAGIVAINAFICPLRSDRRMARQILADRVPAAPMVEVFLSAALEVCEARDPKSLYAKARRGTLREFTGISAPFERPDAPDVSIDTGTVAPEDALQQLVTFLTPLIGADRAGCDDSPYTSSSSTFANASG
jgi:adenylyl-sulfate kinase